MPEKGGQLSNDFDKAGEEIVINFECQKPYDSFNRAFDTQIILQFYFCESICKGSI